MKAASELANLLDEEKGITMYGGALIPYGSGIASYPSPFGIGRGGSFVAGARRKHMGARAPNAWNEFLSAEYRRNGGVVPITALARDPAIRQAYHSGMAPAARKPRRKASHRRRAPSMAKGYGPGYSYSLGGAYVVG